jgi:hypothetical protein
VVIFIDQDGDKTLDTGERSTTTAADGSWSLTGLDASYAGKTVLELVPEGYRQTVGENGYTIIGTSGADQTGLDFANFKIPEGPGVRTPGFWRQTSWAKFWDGIANNEPTQKGQPGFPTGDLFWDPYSTSAHQGKVVDPVSGQPAFGVLIGDYNRNGLTDGSEDTLFYSTTQALQLLSASQKVQQDTRYILGRDLVATWLNYLAGNPIDSASMPEGKDTRYQINAAVDWIQALTPDQTGDGVGDGYLAGMTEPLMTPVMSPPVAANSPYWQTGNAIHTALDLYNNTGFGADGAYSAG